MFISSIINRAVEDLTAERQAARTAVAQFEPVTEPWAFEAEPASAKPLQNSYLDEAKACDVFLLILGDHLTPPVRQEVAVAQDYRKPMLVFCKNLAQRNPDVAQFLATIDCKYDQFTSPQELQDKVRRALGNYLLSRTQSESTGGAQVGDRLARLRALSKKRRNVRIVPTVPSTHLNWFLVEDVATTSVRFQRNGIADVYVPSERIDEILETADHEPPTVSLKGRLQWITIRQNWYFFPDQPPAIDQLGIGLGREVPRQLTLSAESQSWLKAFPLQFAWSNRENVPGREVFFDVDGCHLTSRGQILTYERLWR